MSIKQAIEALEFYATVADYKAPFTGGAGKLWLDCGETARAALAALRSMPAEPDPAPLFYYRPVCNGEMYEGPISAKSVGGQMRMDEHPPGTWKPLFGYPPDAQCTTPPEIDYDLLIAACYGRTGQAQGTKGCVQFAKGAEWYREILAATPHTAPLSDAWISAADQMPPSGQTVLAFYRNSLGNGRRVRAQWVAAKSCESGSESDIGEYDEATDTYYDPEGWYEQIDNWDMYSAVAMFEVVVTHWQPLPPPPIERAVLGRGGEQ